MPSAITHLAETPFVFLPSTFLPTDSRTPKELEFGGFRPSKLRRGAPFGLKTPASWRNGISDYRTLAKTLRVNGFLLFGGNIFRQFKSILSLRVLPGSVAGVYKWLLTPGRWPFWCFLGCFVAKNPLTPTQEVL
jgi:hypothetical protein